MPEVTLRIPTPLQPYSDGNAELALQASTLAEVLDAAAARYPTLVQQILTRDGEVRRYVNVFVRLRDIRELDGLATAVDDGDEIIVMPSVAGG